MTYICELSDTELDAVCGGSLVTITGPFVSIGDSFNSQVQANQQIATIAGNIASGIGLGQLAANLGSLHL